MLRRSFIKSLAAGAGLYAIPGFAGAQRSGASGKSGFTLWQLPPQTGTQMNCYILRTQSGKVIVIDGGNAGDAPYLDHRSFMVNP